MTSRPPSRERKGRRSAPRAPDVVDTAAAVETEAAEAEVTVVVAEVVPTETDSRRGAEASAVMTQKVSARQMLNLWATTTTKRCTKWHRDLQHRTRNKIKRVRAPSCSTQAILTNRYELALSIIDRVELARCA